MKFNDGKADNLESDRKWQTHFEKELAKLHDRYNPENRMLRCPFASPGYHTTIKSAPHIHPTRESMDYALALLDAGEERYEQRAFDIIKEIVSLQDQNPDSPTFGIWSWFWEEPLARMSPPDWNWADFIGKRLLFVYIRHGRRLPEALRTAVCQAICFSCEAIIKRNVGPEYTNIAIMGAFVTLIAGERLGVSRYFEYGFARLRRFYAYTMEAGAFLEYNSPPYSTIAILELSALATYTRTASAYRITTELLDTTWQMIAEHFHPYLQEWSGPHARSYSSFLDPTHLSFLYAACDGEVPLIREADFRYSLEWFGHGVECPLQFRSLFADLTSARELRQDLPPSPEFRTRSAYTYMTEAYAIGTFNHNVMWNQCRNLLAYVRAKNNERCYVRLRVLHDGYDFCSAVFKGTQKGGSVLYGIQFALDGGDTHVNLDPIYGKMMAEDLRIRIEIGCTGQAPAWAQRSEDIYETVIGETGLVVSGLYGAMSGFGPFRWETHTENGSSCLDLILHEGGVREIDFHNMGEALFLFALSLSSEEKAGHDVLISAREHTVQVTSQMPEGQAVLGLELAKKPANRMELFMS
ncbi:hypothetical protein ACFSR7_12940 [Cohnella sp. GCM10020058]|uniref:hypothetical protein n=1 Tax=Cohnella sp. GCM10020058 TaxID=3317330 RepID=UPI00363652FB